MRRIWYQFSFQLYNALGQIIVEESVSVNPGRFTKTINTEGFNAGLYFCEIKSDNELILKKVILQ